MDTVFIHWVARKDDRIASGSLVSTRDRLSWWCDVIEDEAIRLEADEWEWSWSHDAYHTFWVNGQEITTTSVNNVFRDCVAYSTMPPQMA